MEREFHSQVFPLDTIKFHHSRSRFWPRQVNPTAEYCQILFWKIVLCLQDANHLMKIQVKWKACFGPRCSTGVEQWEDQNSDGTWKNLWKEKTKKSEERRRDKNKKRKQRELGLIWKDRFRDMLLHAVPRKWCCLPRSWSTTYNILYVITLVGNIWQLVNFSVSHFFSS